MYPDLFLQLWLNSCNIRIYSNIQPFLILKLRFYSHNWNFILELKTNKKMSPPIQYNLGFTFESFNTKLASKYKLLRRCSAMFLSCKDCFFSPLFWCLGACLCFRIWMDAWMDVRITCSWIHRGGYKVLDIKCL